MSNSSKSGDGFCKGSIIILKSLNWFSFNCTLIGVLSLCPQESARARELANAGLGVQGSSKDKLFIVAAGLAVAFVVPDVNQGSIKTLWFTVTAIGDRAKGKKQEQMLYTCKLSPYLKSCSLWLKANCKRTSSLRRLASSCSASSRDIAIASWSCSSSSPAVCGRTSSRSDTDLLGSSCQPGGISLCVGPSM
uniref:Uncharacterized protein n=1 Tax=Glossina palpalis gambiensis TaxID=67801 RepID=A0A1B0BT27_9MUSC